jgi:hypothetical protein
MGNNTAYNLASKACNVEGKKKFEALLRFHFL